MNDVEDTEQSMSFPVTVPPNEKATTVNIKITAPKAVTVTNDATPTETTGRKWWLLILVPIAVIIALAIGFSCFHWNALTVILISAVVVALAAPIKTALEKAKPQKPSYENWTDLFAVIEKQAAVLTAIIALMKFLGGV